MDLFFSVDVETDGPIPGPYSMLSVGVARAGTFENGRYRRMDGSEPDFYAELKPVGTSFEHEALAVNRLDRDRLIREGQAPEEVMSALAQWITDQSSGKNPVMVAFPLSFDWIWLHWYFVQFSRIGNPFGHSQCLDMKSIYAVKAGVSIREASKSKIPGFLRSRRPHTHHALDDAKEQAELFANLMEWDGGAHDRWDGQKRAIGLF